MAISVFSVNEQEHNVYSVVLAADTPADKSRLNDADVRKMAAAAAAPFLSRPGYDKSMGLGYIPEGSDTPLTDEQMCQPGNVVHGKGRWTQEYIIRGQH